VLITDMETGDMICPECGLVVGDRIVDPSAEWRDYGEGPSSSRVGKAEDPYFEDGLATKIAPPDKNSPNYGFWMQRTQESAKDRSLRQSFNDMADVADRLHLRGIILETARGVCKRVHEKSKMIGDYKGSMGIACLFIACKIEKNARTFPEICKASDYTVSQVRRAYKEVIKLLEFRDNEGISNETQLVERFGGYLDFTKESIKLTTGVVRHAMDSDAFPNKGLEIICGGALLLVGLASGHNVKLKDIVELTNQTRNAIYTAFKTLISRATEFFPDDYVPAKPWKELAKMVVYS